jgi:hypothetical protein
MVKNHGTQTTGRATTCGCGGFPRSRSALLPGTVLIAVPQAAVYGPDAVPQQGCQVHVMFPFTMLFPSLESLPIKTAVPGTL